MFNEPQQIYFGPDMAISDTDCYANENDTNPWGQLAKFSPYPLLLLRSAATRVLGERSDCFAN